MKEDTSARRLGFEPGLDGIRGIAVLIVVLWHFGPDIQGRQYGWLKAGHLGVDLFFVLSGFLITALMLSERATTGRISFAGFYRRRVFRLLPALGFFLLGHVLFAIFADLGPDLALFSPGIRTDDEIASVIASSLFVLNWLPELTDWNIAEGMSHLWSLSVEEQFYIVWPALTVMLMATGARESRLLAGIAGFATAIAGHLYVWDGSAAALRWIATLGVGIAVATILLEIRRRSHEAWTLSLLISLIVAVLLYRNGKFDGAFALPNLYTGTLSRADSLIVGAILAHVWVRGYIPRRGPVPLALLGWAILIWAVTQRGLADPFYYRYGWTLVALAAAVAIWGALDASTTRYGRALSVGWLRAIGKVAYGLYLWHAFVFIAVRHWWGDESFWLKSVLAIGGTAAIVVFSWFVVEKPMLARKNRPVQSPAPTSA